MSKYNNVICSFNGIRFDSMKEMARYHELLLLEKAGEIKELELQKKFELLQSQDGERAITYKADFYYRDKNKGYIAEDVKGMKTQVYIIKRKLFKAKYPDITFVEVI